MGTSLAWPLGSRSRLSKSAVGRGIVGRIPAPFARRKVRMPIPLADLRPATGVRHPTWSRRDLYREIFGRIQKSRSRSLTLACLARTRTGTRQRHRGHRAPAPARARDPRAGPTAHRSPKGYRCIQCHTISAPHIKQEKIALHLPSRPSRAPAPARAAEPERGRLPRAATDTGTGVASETPAAPSKCHSPQVYLSPCCHYVRSFHPAR